MSLASKAGQVQCWCHDGSAQQAISYKGRSAQRAVACRVIGYVGLGRGAVILWQQRSYDLAFLSIQRRAPPVRSSASLWRPDPFSSYCSGPKMGLFIKFDSIGGRPRARQACCFIDGPNLYHSVQSLDFDADIGRLFFNLLGSKALYCGHSTTRKTCPVLYRY
jgi:hypothetical protein